jgi:hypothetical protein
MSLSPPPGFAMVKGINAEQSVPLGVGWLPVRLAFDRSIRDPRATAADV